MPVLEENMLFCPHGREARIQPREAGLKYSLVFPKCIRIGIVHPSSFLGKTLIQAVHVDNLLDECGHMKRSSIGLDQELGLVLPFLVA